jgi:hypothetical protein
MHTRLMHTRLMHTRLMHTRLNHTSLIQTSILSALMLILEDAPEGDARVIRPARAPVTRTAPVIRSQKSTVAAQGNRLQ